MGIVRCMKVMSTGQGNLYIVCDSCDNFCDATAHGYNDLTRNGIERFKCKSCVAADDLRKELEILRAGVKASGVRIVSGDLGDQGEEVVGGFDEREVYSLVADDDMADVQGGDLSKTPEDCIQGVILGDSMVGVLGTNLQRKFSGMARCCLPGAKIAELKKVVVNTVAENDKVVVWAGTNDVKTITNAQFKSEIGDLLGEIKKLTGDISMISLLPRYGVQEHRFWEWKRVQVLNRLLEKLCGEAGVQFIDLWSPCRTDWISRDGIHLSKIGNQVASRLVVDRLMPKN